MKRLAESTLMNFFSIRALLASLVLLAFSAAAVAQVVTITAPSDGTVVSPGSVVNVAATKSGGGTKVVFLVNGIEIGTDTVSPFTASFTAVAGAQYVTAELHNSYGALAESDAVTVYGGAPPTVSLTSPSNGAGLVVPGTFAITASAADSDGSIANVKFYANNTLLATDTTSPYSFSWVDPAVGSYALWAVATDNVGTSITSAIVNVTVALYNPPPIVALTSPASGSSAVAPGNFTLLASASDSNGSIANVKFYAGATLLATTSSPPYTHNWTNVTAGSYALTAVATDNLGATTTSTAVNVTVTTSGGGGGGGTAVSQTRSYVYDEYERLCKTINPESGATVIQYDAAGNILWTADGLNLPSTTSCDRTSTQITAANKTTRTYDELNRVLAVSTPGGTANVTTTYHPDGQVATLVAANPGGDVSTTYTYNKRRLLTSERQINGTTDYTVEYDYNLNGHLSSIKYPDNEVVTYTLDALGRATQVGSVGQVYASNVTYHRNGAIAGFKYGPASGTGPTHEMTQNARLLPQLSRDYKGTTKILHDTYSYDANGNVIDITDGTGSGNTRDMGYDGLDRLIVADGPWGNGTYAYDALDNLRSADQGTRQFRYNYDGSWRLANIKSPAGANLYSFTYDARGNVLSKNGQGFAFDSANRMSSAAVISGATGNQLYKYDGLGRRVQTTDPDATPGDSTDNPKMFWLYTQAGQVLYTSEARRSQNLSYIYLGGSQIATRAKAFGTGTVTIKFQMTDALGSPVANTSTSGGSITRTTYTPWGESTSGVDGTGYTGHVMDVSTGLTYMQQRYYDPLIGRFLAIDPADSEFNRYNYASNNPFHNVDVDGREAIKARSYSSDACGVSGCDEGSFVDGEGTPSKEDPRKGNSAYGVPANCERSAFGCWGYSKPSTISDEEFAEGLLLVVSLHPAGRGVSWLAKGVEWAWKSRRGALLFGQESVKATFAHGPYAGKSIGEVARALRSGKISPDTLPVEYVVRDGKAIVLNNRSLLTFRRAGMEPTVTRNLTGQARAEARVTQHLGGIQPSQTIQVRGAGGNASSID